MNVAVYQVARGWAPWLGPMVGPSGGSGPHVRLRCTCLAVTPVFILAGGVAAAMPP